MTWASLEENQGNSVRAEEIRNLYFQQVNRIKLGGPLSIEYSNELMYYKTFNLVQRTEVVDDAAWAMGFLDIIDPAIDSIKKLLNLGQNPYKKAVNSLTGSPGAENGDSGEESAGRSSDYVKGTRSEEEFDLDKFVR